MENEKDHPYVGVDAIIFNNEGKILLEKRSARMRNYPDFWGLPGGWMDWGETAEQALKREAMEELGIEIEVVKFIGKYFDTPGRSGTRTSVALPHICKIISNEPKVNQVEELSDIGWFSFEEISKMKLAYDHNAMLSYAQEQGFLKY